MKWQRFKEKVYKEWVDLSEVSVIFYKTRLAVRKLFNDFNSGYQTWLPIHKGYQLVFADYFRDGKLNKDDWRIGLRWGILHPTATPYQYSDKSCVNVIGGKLHLTNKYAPKKVHQWVGTPKYKVVDSLYAHGEVSLKKEYLYGIFEISCKGTVAPYIILAFWLDMVKSEKEVDIFEFFPADNNKNSKGQKITIHWPESKNRSMSPKTYKLPLDVVKNFHTYTCEWTPKKLEFKFDGEVIRKFTNKRVMKKINTPASVILGTGIDKKPEIDGHVSSAPFIIDYITIHQKK